MLSYICFSFFLYRVDETTKLCYKLNNVDYDVTAVGGFTYAKSQEGRKNPECEAGDARL